MNKKEKTTQTTKPRLLKSESTMPFEVHLPSKSIKFNHTGVNVGDIDDTANSSTSIDTVSPRVSNTFGGSIHF